MLRTTPRLSKTEALETAAAVYGVRGAIRELPSERDQNFLLRLADGEQRVLKITNTAESPATLEAENSAMQRLHKSGIAVPISLNTLHGESIAYTLTEQPHLVRMLSYVPGQVLAELPHHSSLTLAAIGKTTGLVSRALSNFEHPALDRKLIWDLADFQQNVESRLDLIRDSSCKQLVINLLDRHARMLNQNFALLRRSAIHNDINDYNIIVQQAMQNPKIGIVDFGDMLYSITVAELAVTAAYALLDKADPLTVIRNLVTAYCEVFPLDAIELQCLLGLICMRLCLSVCIAAEQQLQRPNDPYLTISQAPIKRALPKLAALHPEFVNTALCIAAGIEINGISATTLSRLTQFKPVPRSPLGGKPKLNKAPILDLSISSHLLDYQNGHFSIDARKLAKKFCLDTDIAIGRYAEPRLLYNAPEFGGDNLDEKRAIHLGVDFFSKPGTTVYAPLDAKVYRYAYNDKPQDYGAIIILQHWVGDTAFFTLYGHLSRSSLNCLAIGQEINAGQPFATLGEQNENGGWVPHLHFQLITDLMDLDTDFPGVCKASEFPIWRYYSPNPNLILGLTQQLAAPQSPLIAKTIAQRKRHFGANLKFAYREPLKLIRGQMQYLFDAHGRRFLDAYNNVPHVGHCHPAVIAAGQSQMALLNTNTRYLSDTLNEYAYTLQASLPAALDVCWFVNSASEANELALRMARSYTARRGVVVLEAAYHGHTHHLIDISPYKHAGPGGYGAPDWVAVAALPNLYSGRFRGNDATVVDHYVQSLQQGIDSLSASEYGCSAFIAETCPSVGGQVMLPTGYLARAYERVRAAGGVCIADEVQTGYGRLGEYFYAFEQHRVTPDIVVLGKPIGNGHPIGAVITTQSIANAFANGMEFFSTFGGNNVSAAIGLEVLKVMHREQLQHHAQIIGQQLHADLHSLCTSSNQIGQVRGAGLFWGIELVTNRSTREPAGQSAEYVVNRMRDFGILIGRDGVANNVLKIRPPMCFSHDNASLLVECLQEALSELDRYHS